MTNNFTSIRLRASVLWFGMVAAILSFPVAFVTSRSLEMFSWTGLTLAAVLATTFSSILFWWLFIVRPEHISIARGAKAGMVSIIAASFLMCWLSEAYGAAYSIVIQHQDAGGAFLVAAILMLSIVFWWFFTVLPERASIVRGVLAGIMSIIVTPFLMLCFYETYNETHLIAIQHQPVIGTLLTIIETLFVSLAWPIFVVFCVISLFGWVFFPIGACAGGLLAWYLCRTIVSEANLEQKGYCGCPRKIVLMTQMCISRRTYPLLTILGFGILAAIVTFFFSLIFLNIIGSALLLGFTVLQGSFAATIAEGCTSMLCWYWFVVSQKTDKVLHGICAGLVSTFLAHPLMWLVMWPFSKIDFITALTSSLYLGLLSFIIATLGSYGIMLLIASGIGALYALFLPKAVPAFPSSLNIGINLWLIEIHCLLKFV